MRHLLLIILFCAIPFAPSHANQQVVDTIKAIKIEGVSVFTSIEDARKILINDGYKEAYSNRRSTRFNKGACYIELGHMLSTSMLKYKCDSSSPDVGGGPIIVKALKDLCAIENNGKDDRAGCRPANSRTNANRIEKFQAIVGGDKYTAKIWDMDNPSGTRIRHIDIITLISK
ncbi:MAG: hypothetical protein COB36_07030 [Alphaproteobacteria bacterium]|nr:MAG: hypothetical protein COB36_07030 [Alphaproteobacteria bacterium]